ncbi:META domain-containing protein, partial [Burkholderia multivorans]
MDIATQHRPSLRLLLGAVALAATLPLAACANGAEPSEPASSSASDPSTPSETESATVDPVGKWTSPEAGEPFLEFKDDGSLEGSDGCN